MLVDEVFERACTNNCDRSVRHVVVDQCLEKFNDVRLTELHQLIHSLLGGNHGSRLAGLERLSFFARATSEALVLPPARHQVIRDLHNSHADTNLSAARKRCLCNSLTAWSSSRDVWKLLHRDPYSPRLPRVLAEDPLFRRPGYPQMPRGHWYGGAPLPTVAGMVSNTDLEPRVIRLENDTSSVYELIGAVQQALRDHEKQFAVIRGTLGNHDEHFIVIRAILADHDQQFLEIRATLTRHDQQFAEIHATLGNHDEHFTVIRAILADHDQQFAQIHATLADHDEHFTVIHAKLANHDQQFLEIRGILTRHDEQFAEIHTILADHSRRLDNIEATLTDHSRRLDNIEATLTDHSRRLDNIEATLADHGRRLDNIEAILVDHGRRFDTIDAGLAEILRRLPEAC